MSESNPLIETNTDTSDSPSNDALHPDTEHHNRMGIVIVLLIVLLVLVLTGLYLWFNTAFNTTPVPAPTERFVPEMPNEPEMPNANAAIQQLETVSSSDELDAIEADLEATNLDILDTELSAIDAELQ